MTANCVTQALPSIDLVSAMVICPEDVVDLGLVAISALVLPLLPFTESDHGAQEENQA